MGSSELSGCAKCIKWCIFVFNIILWAIGTALLALGIFLYVKYGKFLDDLAGVSWLSAPIIIIVVGGVMIVVCFLGCCGAWRESKCMLYLFSVLIVIIIALEIAGGAVGYVKRDDLEETLQKELLDSLKEYYTSVPVQEAWNFVQKEFDCCGANHSYTEWWNSGTFPIYQVPFSCCDTNVTVTCPDKGIIQTNMSAISFYENGCYQKIKDDIESNYIPVLIAVIVLGCLELCGVVFGFWLACQLD